MTGAVPHAAEAQVAAARRLDGQVAVVTGGGGAIGGGVARRFAEAGALVVLGDIDTERAEQAAAAIGDETVARGLTVDVTSQVAAHAFIAAAADAFGRLDVLVHAAGITHVDPLLEVDAEVWRGVFAVNLDGALFTLQAAARIMRDQPVTEATGRRGTVVNVGSQGSEFVIPTSTAYGASKKALIYLTQTAAAAVADDLIGVSVILPGMVYEGMWKDVNLERSRAHGDDFGERIRRDLDETPSGRFQSPGELADLILFVASSRGLELNGKTIWSEPHVV